MFWTVPKVVTFSKTNGFLCGNTVYCCSHKTGVTKLHVSLRLKPAKNLLQCTACIVLNIHVFFFKYSRLGQSNLLELLKIGK